MEFDKVSSDVMESPMSLRESLDPYLRSWKWILLSMLIGGFLAFMYAYFQVPRYRISATILIKEKEESANARGMESLGELGVFGSDINSLENEIHLLSSRRLMNEVVSELKLNFKYSIDNYPYDNEHYPDFPLILRGASELVNNEGGPVSVPYSSMEINVLNENRFEYINSLGESQGVIRFGQNFQSDLGEISLELNDSFKDEIMGRTIKVSTMPVARAADLYRDKISIEPLDEKSRVLALSMEESVKLKGIYIINNLIEQYNLDAVEDKNLVHRRTTEFLNDRIVLITSELNSIEQTVQQFKSSRGYIDPEAGTGIFLESSSANENELIELNTQLTLVNYMIDELNMNGLNAPLPVNIGLSDQSILNLIGEYNQLILQRIRILKSSTLKNPLIVSLDSQIELLKDNLSGSLNTIKSSLGIQIASLNKQSGRISSKIASVPKNEKDYKDIVRQLETKNTVYLFLLQKREESILSDAITVDKARIIDSAYSSVRPVYPLKGVIYLVGIFLGFLIPVGFIFLRETFDLQVHEEKDVTHLGIPYLGDIPSTSKKNLYLRDNDSSPLAEAFRYLRTNINFMMDSKSINRTVFVTSTQSHEGKTFCAINLASTLAVSGKKTILIALDLRAPKISKYLDLKANFGVSNYITDHLLTVDDILIKKTKFEHLHIIDSGDIPPNPGELLMSHRLLDLFDSIQGLYDYIIVDTAPVGMVTDTIQVNKLSDMTIYVIRANYLDKRLLNIPARLHRENKLKNMALLLNGTDTVRNQYGYGYGYGVEKNKKSKKRYLGLFNF